MSRFKSVFCSLLLLSCISCPCVFAQQPSRWQKSAEISPAALIPADSVFDGAVATLKTGYFVSHRVRLDAALVFGEFQSNLSIRPGFRYYYARNTSRWTLSGGADVNVGLIQLNDEQRHPVDLLVTPLELQLNLTKRLYASIGLTYRSVLQSVSGSKNGTMLDCGLGFRF